MDNVGHFFRDKGKNKAGVIRNYLLKLTMAFAPSPFYSQGGDMKKLLATLLVLVGGNSVAQAAEFEGINFGVGLALTVPINSQKARINDAEVDGNGIVRVKNKSEREAKVLLESHYFFPGDGKWFCPENHTCGHGPFVAIQPGSNGNPISAYGLGWSLGFKRGGTANASWNMGFGWVMSTDVRVLGNGIHEDQPLPAGDQLRYKEINQAGYMWMASFTW